MILTSSVLEAVRRVPDNTYDAVLCDPPYGISFMSKKWDYDVPTVDEWAELLRVCKPGAPLLSFGGSRTFHRLACRIEDAGWELRDTIMYLFGKGFPKSLNVSKALDKGHERPIVGYQTLTGNAAVSLKDKGGTYGVQVGTVPNKTIPLTGPATELAKRWDGYGSALKPAFEPIVLARKPLDGTVAHNVTKWGVGALDIDDSRVGTETVTINRFNDGAKPFGGGAGHEYTGVQTTGRWPANLILDEEAGAALDEHSGTSRSTAQVRRNGARPATHSKGAETYREGTGYSDSGGASRFFYCAKVSTKERNAGCEHLPLKSAGEATAREDGSEGLESPRAGAGRTGGARNHHPTLKPIALTSYLAGLIKPPVPGKLLVPWSGAGSEMIGALLAGWADVTGIERESEYVAIAEARIKHWLTT